MLMAPTVQATQTDVYNGLYGSGQAGAPNHYLQTAFVDNTITGAFTKTGLASESYDTRMQSAIWVIEINSEYMIAENQAGTWRFQAQVDGVNIAGCFWDAITFNAGGLLATLQQPYTYSTMCVLTAPAFGSHSFTMTRATQAGTPAAMLQGTTSVRIWRQDYAKLADTQILAGQTSISSSLTSISAQITAVSGQISALSTAITGFNATELQRYLNTLMAIQNNATRINNNLTAQYNYLTGKFGPPGEPVNIETGPRIMAVILLGLLAVLAYFLERGSLPFKFMVIVAATCTFLLSVSLGWGGLALVGMTASGTIWAIGFWYLARHFLDKKRKSKDVFNLGL